MKLKETFYKGVIIEREIKGNVWTYRFFNASDKKFFASDNFQVVQDAIENMIAAGGHVNG